jgi:hypothetical protein
MDPTDPQTGQTGPQINQDVLQMLMALQGKNQSEGNLCGGPQLPPTDMGLGIDPMINQNAPYGNLSYGQTGAPPSPMMQGLMTPPPGGPPPMVPPPAPMY